MVLRPNLRSTTPTESTPKQHSTRTEEKRKTFSQCRDEIWASVRAEHICALTASVNEEAIILVDPFSNAVLSSQKQRVSESERLSNGVACMYDKSAVTFNFGAQLRHRQRRQVNLYCLACSKKTIDVSDRYARFAVFFFSIRLTSTY